MKFLVVLFLITMDCVRSQYNFPSDSNSNNNTANLTYLYDYFTKPIKNKDGSDTDSFPNITPIPVPGTGTQTCECVPPQLCNDGSINSDGHDNLDIRGQNYCDSFLLKCCEKKYIVNSTKPTIKDNTGCGIRNSEGVGFRSFTISDHEVQFGEFPWMVAILIEESIDEKHEKLLLYKCGASLIHPEVVLTSAHCVDIVEKSTLKIRAGEWDTKSKTEIFLHQDREVKNIIIHPNFYKRGLHNDVALIIVDSPFQLAKNVQTACLPSQDEVLENLKCIATGWGKNSFDQNGTYQVILKKVELPIVQRDICQEQLRNSRVGPFFILDPSLICAGGEPGTDTCTGDGGSPLVCPIRGKKGRYQQRGIVAWGIGCGSEYPAAYGNVAYFRNWIDNEMLKLNLDTSTYTI